MTSSQGTLIQRWNRSCTIGVAILVLGLHISAFIIAAYLCPQLFTARSYEGAHCQPQAGAEFNMVSDCGQERSEEVCRPRDSGDVVRLEDIRMSYKFPAESQVSDGELSVWNWRLVGSIAWSINLLQSESAAVLQDMTQFDQEVRLSASIDYAPLQYLAPDTECVMSAWHSRARVISVNRTLTCHHKTDLSSDVDIVCSLHPFFELFVLSNSSYIVQVQLLPPVTSDHDLGLVTNNVTVTSYLTLARETDSYHRHHFYTKCLFTPLLVMCLVWFMVRLCLNDLYVTIHDRLLITASLAQVASHCILLFHCIL